MPLDDVARAERTLVVVNQAQAKTASLLSLEEVILRIRGFQNRKVYYIRPESYQHVFGIEDSKKMFAVPKEVYAAVGSPAEGHTVKASYLLEIASTLKAQQKPA